MTKGIGILMIISCVLFLSGCISQREASEITQVSTVPITPYVRSTSAETKTVYPSQTPLPVTPSLIPTNPPVLATKAQPDVIRCCMDILPNPPDQHDYTGIISLETHLPGSENPIRFLDLISGEMREFKGKLANLSVSPNRKMFVYEDHDAQRLKVFTGDVRQLKSIAYGKYWGSISQWLGNQSIAILLAEPDPADSRYGKYPPDKVLVNPFTNKEQVLHSAYPDIDDVSPFCPWGRLGCTVYDPTLTRVVYPGTTSFTDEKYGSRYGGYILFGIPEMEKLAEIVNLSWFNHPPVWSPDGSQFIMMGDAEFYLVSYDGAVSKITNINPLFDLSTAKGLNYQGEYYSWSPDGKHISLWLVELSSMRRTLAILEISTGIITNTCIQAGYDPNDIRTEPYPVWAPDGKSLVVAANYRPEENGNDVVLIDLEKGTGYIITKDLFPVGWLVSQ